MPSGATAYLRHCDWIQWGSMGLCSTDIPPLGVAVLFQGTPGVLNFYALFGLMVGPLFPDVVE